MLRRDASRYVWCWERSLFYLANSGVSILAEYMSPGQLLTRFRKLRWGRIFHSAHTRNLYFRGFRSSIQNITHEESLHNRFSWSLLLGQGDWDWDWELCDAPALCLPVPTAPFCSCLCLVALQITPLLDTGIMKWRGSKVCIFKENHTNTTGVILLSCTFLGL